MAVRSVILRKWAVSHIGMGREGSTPLINPARPSHTPRRPSTSISPDLICDSCNL